MDSEFPDPDEEFELMHRDEYEYLKEIEAQHKQGGQSQKPQPITAPKKQEQEKVFQELNTPTASCSKKFNDSYTNDGTKKRTFEELFGEIGDAFDAENLNDIYEHVEKKPRWDQPQDVIKMVLDARDKYHEQNSGIPAKQKYCNNENRPTISLRVPSWNFIAVTRTSDSQRIYVRVRNEDHKIEENAQTITTLLSVPYSQLKAEAEEILVKNVARASSENSKAALKGEEDDELWVDKYRPRSYIELLSDESVNRHFLHWLKLWDKVVFNRNFVQNKKQKEASMFKNKKFVHENSYEEVDNKGFPIHRIVLLSGPPGLGKTTLAHLAARHAGYNVVEINASDERSPVAFKQVLLASTQMKAVMGSDPKPNCLVLDEIDGAPAASIDVLLKFVQGKLASKTKKEKSKADATTCHRPIICICNEPYTPSLRALRATALIIPVPEVTPSKLADRLLEVARKERLKVNPTVLLKLAEISGCDVRSCLGALQYMGGASNADNLSFALKDSRKGLFDSWKEILTVPTSRSGLLSMPERVRKVLKTVQNGETEKLAQGIFHNYPEICGEKLEQVTISLEWFQFFDEVLSLVANHQVWTVMPYTNHAFVMWHLNLARTRSFKLSYPSIMFEVNQKLTKNVGILTSVQRSSGRDVITLAMDIAPLLPDLLSPRVRTVSGHLHSSKEKADIVRLVNVLLEFGLTFTQEKNLDGNYEYKLDPNIFEIGIFPDCKVRRPLVYAVKQIIVQELEAERLRRAASITGITKSVQTERPTTSSATTPASSTLPQDKNVPNARPNVPKPAEKKLELKEIQYKDFFGRPIVVNQDGNKKRDDLGAQGKSANKGSLTTRELLTKHGVWYKYKEGFSNAVRRNVLMEELL